MKLFLIAAILLAAAPAMAAEDPLPLKPGPGSEVTATNCNICHTSNYIIMNSTFLSPAGWKAEVGKMRTVFGAPLDDETQATITAYLSTFYTPKP